MAYKSLFKAEISRKIIYKSEDKLRQVLSVRHKQQMIRNIIERNKDQYGSLHTSEYFNHYSLQ